MTHKSLKIPIDILTIIWILCLTVKVQARCAASPQQQKEEICHNRDSPYYENDIKITTLSQISLKVAQDIANQATCPAEVNLQNDWQHSDLMKNITPTPLAIQNLSIHPNGDSHVLLNELKNGKTMDNLALSEVSSNDLMQN